MNSNEYKEYIINMIEYIDDISVLKLVYEIVSKYYYHR